MHATRRLFQRCHILFSYNILLIGPISTIFGTIMGIIII